MRKSMKNVVQYVLALTVVSRLMTGSLCAQDCNYECDSDYECGYECSAPQMGCCFLGLPVWTWITGGLVIGGIAAVAALHQSNSGTN